MTNERVKLHVLQDVGIDAAHLQITSLGADCTAWKIASSSLFV